MRHGVAMSAYNHRVIHIMLGLALGLTLALMVVLA